MEPVLACARRTPQGEESGVFADVRSDDLSIPLVNEILAETGLGGDQVDDLLLEMCETGGRARKQPRSTTQRPARFR